MKKSRYFTILTETSEKQTYFVTAIHSIIFRIREVIWSQNNHLTSINWSKFNTLSTEKYYFLNTIS